MFDEKQQYAQVPGNVLADFFAPAFEYMIDAAQRSVLFADVMRRQHPHDTTGRDRHMMVMGRRQAD